MLFKPLAAVALFVAGGLAFPEITDQIRKEFQMGLFPRVVTNLQVRFDSSRRQWPCSYLTDSDLARPSRVPWVVRKRLLYVLLAFCDLSTHTISRELTVRFQITESGNPDRPFAVDGDTFVWANHHRVHTHKPRGCPLIRWVANRQCSVPARLRDGGQPGL